MAGKETYLKKRLLRDGIIVSAILIVLGAIGFVLSGFDDDAQSQVASIQGNISSMHNEYSTIKNQLGSAYEVQNYYEVYVRNHNDDFSLNRETVTNLLSSFKEKYHFANLGVTIAPITDLTGNDVPQIKLGTLVKSEVKLSFTALTDNDIYGFIGALQRGLPGIVLVRSLQISRMGELTKNILVDLNQHRVTPLVKGEMTFIWLGIRQKPEENTAEAGAHAH